MLLVFTLTILSVSAKADDISFSLDQSELQNCLHEVIDLYFSHDTMFFFGTDTKPIKFRNLVYKDEEEWFEDSLKSVEESGKNVVVYNNISVRRDLHYYRYQNRMGKMNQYIIKLEDSDVKIKNNLKKKILVIRENPIFQSYGRILLVVQSEDMEEYESISKNIIITLWDLTYAINVIVMIINSYNEYYFYTWFPYRVQECKDVVNVTLVDVWRNGTFEKKNYFYPSKIKNNLNRCNLYVTSTYIPPYAIRQKMGEGNDGLEDIIQSEVAKHVNMTLIYVQSPPGISFWTPKISEKQYGGAFTLLHEHKADLSYGSMKFSVERFYLSEALTPYYEDHFSVVVPLPDPLPTWKNIYFVFSLELWNYVGLFFVLITLTLYAIGYFKRDAYFRKFFNCLFEALSISLSVPTSFLPKSGLLKCFILSLLIYSFHITSAYQSALIVILTKPLSGVPLKTVYEALDRGLIPYIFPSLRSFRFEFGISMWDEIEKTIVYTESYNVTFDSIVQKKGFTIFVSNVAEYIINSGYLDQNGDWPVMRLKKYVITFPLSAYMAPGHPLKFLFDWKMKQLIESGLPQYWISDVLRRSRKIQRQTDNGKDRPLTLKHLGGAYLLLLFGLLLGLCMFMAEHVTNYIQQKHFSKVKIKVPSFKNRVRCMIKNNRKRNNEIIEFRLRY